MSFKTATSLARSFLTVGIVIAFVFGSPTDPADAADYPYAHTFEDGSVLSVTTSSGGNGAQHYYIGATIGLNWSALPDRQHVNWFTSGPNKHALDFHGDVYVTGPFTGRIVDHSWYYGTWLVEPRIGIGCCYYIDCPDVGTWSHSFVSPRRNEDCTSCPLLGTNYVDLYENLDLFELIGPGTGKFEGGDLQIVDGHGGANAVQLLELEAIRGSGENHQHYHLFFGIVPPGRYIDVASGQPVDRFPGDTFLLSFTADGIPVSALPVKAVQLVSTDISAASPGTIDASDLGSLASALGNCVSYCTDTGCQPDGSPDFCTWRMDVNVSGPGTYIDASDLSVWAAEVELEDCLLVKAGEPSNNINKILAWFGMMKTGETIVQPDGSVTPEIVIVDEAQMARAIADPYGYTTQPAGLPQTWSKMKSLYR
jgi:hypothetical protein